MDEPCDICGDIGVQEALITCSQCRINSEHMYCMRTLLENPVDDWRCEECESGSSLLRELPSVPKINSPVVRKAGEVESRKLQNESRMRNVRSGDWEKKVTTGKAKYIPVKEAIRLSTGERKVFAFSNSTCRSKPPRPKMGVDRFERRAIRRKTVPLSFFTQQDLASGPLQQPKPQTLSNMDIHEGQLQESNELTEVLRSASSLQPSQAPKEKYMQNEQLRELRWAHKKARRLVKKRSSSAPSLDASPITISGGNVHIPIKRRSGDADNMNNNLLPDMEKCSFTPALEAFWKGSFSIQDVHLLGEQNHQIQAHPPSIVRRKIFDFSKKMPEVLHFQLVPARTCWINLFGEYIPDERDIGLYFFPSVGERANDYICLLESISERNLALRIQILDVELLVFTSSLLPVHCQCWNGKYFLWGVFHRLKRDTTACSDNRALELAVLPSDDASHGHDQVDESEKVEMNIHMIGGINMGSVDVPVQKGPVRGKSTSFSEESAAAMALCGSSDQQIICVSRRSSDPFCTIPSVDIKTEFHDLIPPGFEEAFKLRIQGFSSSAENAGGREGK